MRKIIFILPVLLLIGSCATSRKSYMDFSGVNPTDQNKNDFSASNITNNNIFIEKADLEVISDGTVQNVLLTVKHVLPGSYLVSVRSKTGIEAARISITRDSIHVNDRMNRVLYYGGTNVLSARYGIEYSLIPVIFGDIVSNGSDVLNKQECIDGYRIIQVNVKGKMIQYKLDCKSNKLTEASIKGDKPGSQILLSFSKFVKSDSGTHPSYIIIEYPDRQLKVNIRIRKINYKYEGKTDFIPGAKYERRELL